MWRVAAMAFAVLALCAPSAWAGWSALNDAANDPNGSGSVMSLIDFQAAPTVSWLESATGTGTSHSRVARSDGSWTTLPAFMNDTSNNGGTSQSSDLAVINGTLHVAWTEKVGAGNFEVYVSTYNGTTWSRLGGSGNDSPINNSGTANAANPQITEIGGVPWVTWSEFDPVDQVHEVRVKQWVSTAAAWLPVGGVLNTTPTVDAVKPQIVNSLGSRPVVAWVELVNGNGGQLRAARHTGSSWQSLGTGSTPINNSATGLADNPSLVSIAATPYLAWQEYEPSDPPPLVTHVRVKRFQDGLPGSWRSVAPASPVNDPSLPAASPSIANIEAVPYVAYLEADDPSSVQVSVKVKRLSSGGNSWVRVAGTNPIRRDPTRTDSNPKIAEVGLDHVPTVVFDESADTGRPVYGAQFFQNLTNDTPPQISGTPRPGSNVFCTQGTWNGSVPRRRGQSPTQYDYIWERAPRNTTADDDPAWGSIDGASGSTYTAQAADVGSRIRCRVIATSDLDIAEAVSRSLRGDAGPPVSSAPPAVEGVPVSGRALTCTPGAWDTGPDFSYQWLRNGDPIAGATASTYVPVPSRDGRTPLTLNGDGGKEVTCEVTASNDVGSSSPVRSAPVHVVDGPPYPHDGPFIRLLDTLQVNPVGRRVLCETGGWTDDYAILGIPGYPYEFEWRRNGAVIPGETGQTHLVTIEDLGQGLRCAVTTSNAAGRSEQYVTGELVVPLPASASAGQLMIAPGTNQFVPVNLLAIGREYREAVEAYIVERLTAAKDAETTRCEAQYPIASLRSVSSSERLAAPLGERDRCRILLLHRFRVLVYPNGVKYQDRCPFPTSPECLDLGFAIPPVDPTRPPPLDLATESRLAPFTPTQVLWDVNNDGRVDATCDGSAPVLRSMFDRGQWNPRAIIVYPDSAETGLFSEARGSFANPRLFTNLPPGALRPAQPFACRTSIEQPPEPKQQPCVTEGTIGRVHITGNLCPINVRSMTPNQIEELRVNDGQLFEVLVKMADEQNRQNPQARAASRVYADHEGGIPSLMPRQFAFRNNRVSASFQNMASSLPTFVNPNPAAVTQLVPRVTNAVENLLAEQKAQFTLDQIYVARETLKVNGVTVEPLKSATLLIPTDVKEGLKNPLVENAMKIRSIDAASRLGNVVLAEKGFLTATFSDSARAARDAILRSPNLDEIRNSLRSLDLGPFDLSGQANIKLEDDGTATVTAKASIDILTGWDGKPLKGNVRFSGDRDGNLRLEGITIEMPEANLFGLQIKGLFLRYDDGLTVRGRLTFPPTGEGFEIHNFQLDRDGGFEALDVEYLAGAGSGIPVGPGVFMTSLRGGYIHAERLLRAGTTLSVGPSTGGGCPTLGATAQFDLRFVPIVSFNGTANIRIVCLGLASITVKADSTGYVGVSGGVDVSVGPAFFKTQMGGSIKLPNWQIEYNGEGGVRGVPLIGTLSAQIQGVLSNRGLAVCGRVEFLFVDLAAGAGVRFPGGRPPLTPAELIENIRIFTGCDLSSYRSLPTLVGGSRAAHAAQAAGRSFTLEGGSRGVVLSLEGAGDAPRVTLRSPSGKVYDFSDAGADGKLVDNAFGTVAEGEDRTVVLMRAPEAGRWTADVAPGSPAIVRVRQADVLPKAKVTGSVGGIGASRVLRYDVRPIDGQVVNLVEEAEGARKVLRRVRGGGRGTARFVTSEAQGTARRIVAEVTQDGLGRDNIVVARFSAPNPKVGRPRRLRVRRRGRTAVVTWRRAVFAQRYAVIVQAGDGGRTQLTPRGRRLRVTVPGVSKREGLVVRVAGFSAGGRRGPAAQARLKGSLRLGDRVRPRPLPRSRSRGGRRRG